MRRTLERLKDDANSSVDDFIRFSEMLTKNLNSAGLKVLSKGAKTILACIRYIQALEDYGGELDEEWDKLLKSIEQVGQGKSTKKKEDKRKTSYRV
jgi:hypothetical protein